MQIHLIAVGGAVMHNLAIALHRQGHLVSGSDDEIYNPAHDRLKEAGLLPEEVGWRPERVHRGLDVVILGMHARADNPELRQAQTLGLPVVSYPEFIHEHAKEKQRLVMIGSHGKTTTTAMTMHALRLQGIPFDYLVGAQLEGFDAMVSLTDAPVMVIEGDEYLSSPLDSRPKMLHYRPHTAVLTGIAWDHINVFPSFEAYLEAFARMPGHMAPGGTLYWPASDAHARDLFHQNHRVQAECLPFEPFHGLVEKGRTSIDRPGRPSVPLQIFGRHNLLNARAAALLCASAGVGEDAFLEALSSFPGAGRRLEQLGAAADRAAWLDFAHAPSKVAATTLAVAEQFPERHLVAGMELHTFSSLNPSFLPMYRDCLDPATDAFVFFSPETLKQKNMPALEPDFIKKCFSHPRLQVFTHAEALDKWLSAKDWRGRNLLLMSSGRFGGWNATRRVPEILELPVGPD